VKIKLLSTAILILTTSATAPLALAVNFETHLSNVSSPYQKDDRHSHYQPGKHYGKHKNKHRDRRSHNRHHDHDAHRRHDRHHRNGYYSVRYSYSSTPIIVGSVIGGVMGHEIGHGNPGHTTFGALLGTMIGYDITRHRNH